MFNLGHIIAQAIHNVVGNAQNVAHNFEGGIQNFYQQNTPSLHPPQSSGPVYRPAPPQAPRPMFQPQAQGVVPPDGAQPPVYTATPIKPLQVQRSDAIWGYPGTQFKINQATGLNDQRAALNKILPSPSPLYPKIQPMPFIGPQPIQRQPAYSAQANQLNDIYRSLFS